MHTHLVRTTRDRFRVVIWVLDVMVSLYVTSMLQRLFAARALRSHRARIFWDTGFISIGPAEACRPTFPLLLTAYQRSE
jgi:hypothetical protein